MRFLGFSTVFGLLGLAAAGCTDDGSSLYISHSSIFEFEEGSGCTASTDAQLARAQFNVAFAQNRYIMPAVVTSQLVRRDVATSAEPNGVNIIRAEVQIFNEGGQALTGEYSTIPSSGIYIPPSGVGELAQAIVSFPVIPAPVTQQLQDFVRGEGEQTVMLEIRVIGRTTGGSEITSAPFHFGIELVDRPLESVCVMQLDAEQVGLLSCSSGQDGLPYLQQDC